MDKEKEEFEVIPPRMHKKMPKYLKENISKFFQQCPFCEARWPVGLGREHTTCPHCKKSLLKE